MIMDKMTISVGKGKDAITATAAKVAIREWVQSLVITALQDALGEDAAGLVRVESETTGKGENLVGAIVADIMEDGGVFDAPITIKVTCKEWVDRVGVKTVKPAWDFAGARERYEQWFAEDTAKKEAAAASKKAKAEADAAARAKRKAEAEAKKKAKGEGA